ncbi:hypothetical protein HX088_00305 [Empedobacter sp. 225-1]|uniref:hypothetical protein n=1 Tax=Empedobacter sp. 225-1 TaxID=2746725 RepID=UPI002578BB8A|nr:hypothetical protein [Empedobacter sp. 225-1]MDM1521723.1 hypothetical protein [Empedobacter sp. 225-1]
MAKKTTYGFTTPVRRSTKNVTGNKVGGELTGGEYEIKNLYKLTIDSKSEYYKEIKINITDAPNLFLSEDFFSAIGGYFISNYNCIVEIGFKLDGNTIINKTFNLQALEYTSIGLDYSLNKEENIDKTLIAYIKIINFNDDKLEINYTHFNAQFISYTDYVDNIEFYRHYNNSKKEICYPEQFYFDTQIILDGSIPSDINVPLKSCNRCQRKLPINPYNERMQLAFSNHCSTKAPCRHSSFSTYKNISPNNLTIVNLNVNNKIENGVYKSYYGHQLECKACKKFYVNAALNHLRTSTQHREDSLRRRSFELLCAHLLKSEWIYHKFKKNIGKEFDVYIHEKFNKKCFKCDKNITKAKDMHLDHTMPLSHLYPLDETATCLCPNCNSLKSDILPKDFYSEAELTRLSEITGIDRETLSSNRPNEKIINLLKSNLKWFFEEFILHPDYQKERDGKKAADSIIHSLQKIINKSQQPYNLIEEYNKL